MLQLRLFVCILQLGRPLRDLGKFEEFQVSQAAPHGTVRQLPNPVLQLTLFQSTQILLEELICIISNHPTFLPIAHMHLQAHAE